MARGTTNTNSRGSAEDRRQRKLWLLLEFGDGETAPCCFCGEELTFETITVDRIIPGALGGRYTRDNIRPACGHCNILDGVALRERLKHGRKAHCGRAEEEGHRRSRRGSVEGLQVTGG